MFRTPDTSPQAFQLACTVLDKYPDIPMVGMFVMRPAVEAEAITLVFGEPLTDEQRQSEAEEVVDDLAQDIASTVLDRDYPEFGVDVVGLKENWNFRGPVERAVTNGLRAAYLLMHESVAA